MKIKIDLLPTVRLFVHRSDPRRHLYKALIESATRRKGTDPGRNDPYYGQGEYYYLSFAQYENHVKPLLEPLEAINPIMICEPYELCGTKYRVHKV